MPDFITIASFTSVIDARIAKGVLDQHGIPALIANEHVADMNLPGVVNVTGIELRVDPSDADAANSLIPDDSAVYEARSLCPRCGSKRTGRRNSILRGIFMDLLGLPTEKMNRQWRCQACSNNWELDIAQ